MLIRIVIIKSRISDIHPIVFLIIYFERHICFLIVAVFYLKHRSIGVSWVFIELRTVYINPWLLNIKYSSKSSGLVSLEEMVWECNPAIDRMYASSIISNIVQEYIIVAIENRICNHHGHSIKRLSQVVLNYSVIDDQIAVRNIQASLLNWFSVLNKRVSNHTSSF